MASEPERVILTYEDLLQLPNDRYRYEILDGELQVTAAPSTAHQTVVGNLFFLLTGHVRRCRLGQVFTAPLDVFLTDITVVQPDLVFVAESRKEIIFPQCVRGAPDLVVEVLSPSTAQTDRGGKRQIYARHGIPSYWLLDPDRYEFVAYALEAGIYRQAILGHDADKVAALPFPDLDLHLEEIWGWDS